uniref:Uncharacterized protein n=1 Tax=Cacopsylla melanoneura TaxID=428564 RepID=A0A8D8ZIB1_9HEMI
MASSNGPDQAVHNDCTNGPVRPPHRHVVQPSLPVLLQRRSARFLFRLRAQHCHRLLSLLSLLPTHLCCHRTSNTAVETNLIQQPCRQPHLSKPRSTTTKSTAAETNEQETSDRFE